MSHMVRILLFLFALSTLIACAKTPGFKAEDFTYAVALKEDKPTDKKEEPTYQPGSVVRTSQRVAMKPLETKWTDKNLTMTAEVKIDGKSYGSVKFKGVQQDSKVVLTAEDPALKDTLKAQVHCTSDEGTCENFFIDIVFKDNDVLYHDQMIATPKDPTKQDPIPKPAPKPSSPTPAPSKDPKNPTPAPAPAPAEPAEPADETFEFIDLEKIKTSGFIGISDDEARELFNISVAKPADKSGEAGKSPTQQDGGKKEEPQRPVPKPPVVTPQPTPSRPVPPVQPPIKGDGPVEPTDGKKDDGKTPSADPSDVPAPIMALRKFKVKDQAINWPFRFEGVNGRLDRGLDFRQIATSIPDIGFKVVGNTIHNFGTYNMVQTIASLGQWVKEILPNRYLQITSIALKAGGPSNLHSSHQNGTDIDILYMRNNENAASDIVEGSRVSTNFLVKEQWALTKRAFQSGQIDMIFMDKVVKKSLCDYAVSISDYKRGDQESEAADIFRRIQHVDGHQNHFHIRVKCGADDPRCRKVPYKTMPIGC